MKKDFPKPDENPAHNIFLKILKLIQRIVTSIGRPFYFLLAFITLFFLFGIVPALNLTKEIAFGCAIFVYHLLSLNGYHKRGKRKFPQVKIQPRIVVLLLLPLLSLSFFWFFLLRDLPSPQELTTRKQEISTKIYDRNGVLLYKIFKSQNRTPVTLSTVPISVRQATLAAEDAEFYSHLGFSVRGILRAAIRNLKKGELTGGSTITQQLVKNTLLNPEKNLRRKIRELVLAVGVEINFNKDTILEMYLNEVSYGGTAYGIQEAARYYFGKDVNQLTLAEAAFLAGLTKSPTKFSPFGTSPELGIARQRDVLNLMAINHFISTAEAESAKGEELNFVANRTEIKAPHFVMFVREALEEKYGPEVVEQGGLEVYTSLDYEIQKLAEGAVATEIQKLAAYHVGNGAALVINPQSGEILALVGSKDYFDLKNDGNVNVTTAIRQPGSSIKIVNYAYALGHGFTDASILDDSPVTFKVPGSEAYSPQNYDGKYRGRLALRNAFAESRNIPAVKVLASYGVKNMIEQGQKMGITTWGSPANYGLSLTLGGGGVKLIDLANVYATVTNLGKKPEINPILKITNYKGRVLEENPCGNLTIESKECKQDQVLDQRVAFLLTDILKDATARIPAFGRNSQLVIANHPEVAVKTGTSNDMRDNLTVGFNQNYLVAVWVGNNDNSPMARIASGITGAAPIWNKIMTNLLINAKSQDWPVPEGLTQISICPYTATLPCEGCPTKKEWFLKGTEPKKYCSPEWFQSTPAPSPFPQIL